MRKSGLLLFAAALALAWGGCSDVTPPSESTPQHADIGIPLDLENPCGEAYVTTLYAGQHIDVGTVTVINDDDSLRVTIDTRDSGWVLTESHFGIALSLDDLPQTGSGNPQIGKFELQDQYDPPVSLATYQISLAEYGYEPGDELFLAVHAKVELRDEGGQTVQEETAWGDGLDFPGNSWAMYFNYNVQTCVEPTEITVISPSSSLGLCTYFPSTINWTSQNAGPSVKIELYVYGYLFTTITSSTENDGVFEWTPTQYCTEEGCEVAGYTIVVTDLTSGVADESDFTFYISPGFCGE